MTYKLSPQSFVKYNVADTCSIWNILSSIVLYRAATSKASNCYFCCTQFVCYECLIRTRNNQSDTEAELKRRLIEERERGNQFVDYSINIEDLQDMEALENRKRLGKGELSSIILAKKTRQAFITDDKKARNLAEKVLDANMVQTTPHLFGWLLYSNILNDSDKTTVIKEHSKFRTTNWGNLTIFFEKMYMKALEYKLMDNTPKVS